MRATAQQDARMPVIVAARRTPIVTSGRSLRSLSDVDLMAAVLSAVHSDLPAHAPLPADVIVGMARGPGGNPARSAVLASGLPLEVPAVTIDRQCGAGLDAACLGAAEILSGSDYVIAAGVESASNAQPGRASFAPADFGDPDMGPAAEDLAQRLGLSRARQDSYARRSHDRALASQQDGTFDAEIIVIGDASVDDRPRSLRPEVLARMPSVFAHEGTVTAGNSCGISDGAAGIAIVSEQLRRQWGAPGLTIRGWARVGVDPRWPGMGPAPAVREVLARCEVSLEEIDRFEITEAFAAQVLAVLADLGIADDDDRVCADGGAIALGHPWGASGTILLVRLFTALVRNRVGSLGLAACAIGGGQGIALLVERVDP